MTCSYNKTALGVCHQQAMLDDEFCYYHGQVRAGYIEPDEAGALKRSEILAD